MNFLPAALLQPKPYRRGVIIAASILALSGCVSSVDSELETTTRLAAPVAQDDSQAAAQAGLSGEDGTAAAQQRPADGSYRDPMVASTAEADGIGPAETPAPIANAPANMAGLTMQATSVDAGRTSIFAAPGSASNAASPADGVVPASQPGPDAYDQSLPAYVPVPQFNPAMKSMFSSNAPATAPQQGASLGAPARTLSQQAAALEAAEAPLPASPETTQTIAAPRANAPSPAKPEALTLAAFFGGMRKAREKTEGAAPAAGSGPKTITAAAGSAPQQAMVSGSALGDLIPDNFYLEDDEFDDGHDDAPEGLMRLASLPGMTRTAPNGLVLQTPKVDVACMRPELVRMIKTVETHYGRSAIVTSGFRPAKHNSKIGGRSGSLHTVCAAADIQIPGVSKWELAAYLRSRPDRGGVGTYCHTESVHLDIGKARDWNWRCRSKKK